MIYTVERVCSCVGKSGRALFRLTYESCYIPELSLWRHVLVDKVELITEVVGSGPQRQTERSLLSADGWLLLGKTRKRN